MCLCPLPCAELQGRGQGWILAQPKYEDGESKSDEGLVNVSLQYCSADGQISVSGYAAQGKCTVVLW